MVKPPLTHFPEIAILGGGQLGKMLCQQASKWSLYTHVLDRSLSFPAASVCNRFVEGDFTSYDEVYKFGRNKQFLTIEIEGVNTRALHALHEAGTTICPHPEALDRIKDKLLQKEFFREHGIPTSGYRAFRDLADIRRDPPGFPFVLKARRDGYDGRGVMIIRNAGDLADTFDTECIVEEMVDIEMELAVISARNAAGDIRSFPPVGMSFDPDANLVEYLFCPVALPEQKLREATALAESVIEAFGICGLLAVEMFLTKDGMILINEVAPRPHNSGHHTIEACNVSQYEQHLRAILNLPLADVRLKSPAVMVNLLGAPGFSGPAQYQGLTDCLGMDETYLHLYGKAETRPWRKMGHVTILGRDLQSALNKAARIRDTLKVVA